MADFIARLAERALEAAPVVQPPIPSMFAPEPTTSSAGLAWDEETPSEDPDRPLLPPTVAPSPKKMPEDTATARSEVQGAHLTPPLPSGASILADPRRLAESRPLEHGVTSGQEDQSTAPSTPNNVRRSPDAAGPDLFENKVALEQEDRQSLSSGSPRETSESRPGTSHLVEPDLSERWGTLVDNGRGTTPSPAASPGTRGTVDAGGGTMGSETIPVRSAPPAAAPLVAPGVVRPQLNDELDRGPREPRMAEPEPPAPTIRVAIGRIEVRAITPPPPPPTQRPAPAQPGPALSLDDYLKQRNGERR